jgi:hypothetical protein
MIKYIVAWAVNAEIVIHIHYFKLIKTQLLLIRFNLCLIKSNKVSKLINLGANHLTILFFRVIEPLREYLINPINIRVLVFLNSSLNFKYFISSKNLFDLVEL